MLVVHAGEAYQARQPTVLECSAAGCFCLWGWRCADRYSKGRRSPSEGSVPCQGRGSLLGELR